VGRYGEDVPVICDLHIDSDPDMGSFCYAFVVDLRKGLRDADRLRVLETALSQSPTNIVITDIRGRIEYVNPAFTNITGYTARDVLGQNPRVLKSGVHDDEFYKELWSTISSGNVWRNRICNRKKDGTRFWENAVIAPVRDTHGEIRHYIAIKDDITELVALEDELQKNVTELELIMEHVEAGIIHVRNRRILKVNTSFAESFGMSASDLEGRQTKILYDSEEEWEAFGRKWYPVLLSGETAEFEHQFRGRWFHVLASAVDIDNTEELDTVWVFHDITKIKKMEDDLICARDRAEEASRAKGDFLANMSHEIRTPLNAIIGMSHLLMDTKLDEQQKNYLKTVINSSELLLGLINDILDFSKIEAGELLLEERPFNLDSLLEHVETTMSGFAREKMLLFTVTRAPDMPEAFTGDRMRIIQILVNLVNNAIKFTSKGGVVLSACMQGIEKDNIAVLKFEVEDSGVGIAEEDMHKLFQSFQQTDASVARRFGGTGLGLAICRKLVELMGGEIGVESEVGEGSRFFFTIRCGIYEGELEDEFGQTESAEPPEQACLDILLAEDNPANRQLARIVLEKAGHKVKTAENGMEAVSMLAKGDFDVILMDVQMPLVDGLRATEVIRAFENGRNPECQHMPAQMANQLSKKLAGGHVTIIAMTANAMSGDRQRCLEAGMDDYLTKPFNMDDLLRVLSRIKPATDGHGPFEAGGHKDGSASANNAGGEDVDNDDEGCRLAGVFAWLKESYSVSDEQAEMLVGAFRESATESLVVMKRTLVDNDLVALARAAHKIKGGLMQMGLDDIAEIARTIEESAKDGREMDYQAAVDELDAKIAPLLGNPDYLKAGE
jgi:PAS domain S-box-containing protein